MPGIGSDAIASPQRQMKALALRKTGVGTPVLSGLCSMFCSITKNGVGDYTILVNTQAPFNQSCIAVAMPHSSGIVRLNLATTSALQVSVKAFAVDGTTAAELDFDLMVFGSAARDLVGI